MVGLYFSGTGNTKYCIEQFLQALDSSAPCVSIEDGTAAAQLEENDVIILAYPIYYSNLPKIVRDFLTTHHTAFAGKQVFLIATMGLFSGDGTGCAARLLAAYGAHIVGGLHLKMPDCIGDEKALKKTLAQNKSLVKAARDKAVDAARRWNSQSPPQEGLGVLAHLAGLFGQRLWFYGKTKQYSNQLRIHADACVGCGRCVALCPLDNLKLEQGKATAMGRCTLCYRCVSHCPHQAITLLGKTLYEQCKLDSYL